MPRMNPSFLNGEHNALRIALLESATRIVCARITAGLTDGDNFAEDFHGIAAETRVVLFSAVFKKASAKGEVPTEKAIRSAAESFGLDPLRFLPEMTTHPVPTHPLASDEHTVEERIAGTVSDDAIVCLECGKSVTLLKTHLKAVHEGMTFATYRDRHGLPYDYPPTAPAHRRRQQAQMLKFRRTGERMPEDELVRRPKHMVGKVAARRQAARTMDI